MVPFGALSSVTNRCKFAFFLDVSSPYFSNRFCMDFGRNFDRFLGANIGEKFNILFFRVVLYANLKKQDFAWSVCQK